jgi:hypothetical protein
MNKLRTISDIQNHLNDEFGWRIQEIDNLKKVIPRVDSIQTRSLLRAGVPILYAHWEGFVKKSSDKNSKKTLKVERSSTKLRVVYSIGKCYSAW